MRWPTWHDAMDQALYGPDGFFRREQPADHFRTSVHASELFAAALVRLAEQCGTGTVIDVGAGRGELLTALARLAPSLELVGVELASRPPDLPSPIEWLRQLPDGVTGSLVIANEWLDNIPVDVVEVDAAGRPRLVHVDPSTGEESLGRVADGELASWLDTWWPLANAPPGRRAEIGSTRDGAWRSAVQRVRRGVLVAIDYTHHRDDRPPFGTLAAYRDGRTVRPVPDGSRDITAHVAVDACAAAGEAAGATTTVLTTQRHALRTLGVDARLPPRELATNDPPAYVQALGRTSEAAELLDSAGFGGFEWLIQSVGIDVPEELTRPPRT